MKPEAALANCLYVFATFVLAAIEQDETARVVPWAQECQDLALEYLTSDFRV